ncbi:hypothetical protein AAY473_010314 [Plecturocebus cupreus]
MKESSRPRNSPPGLSLTETLLDSDQFWPCGYHARATRVETGPQEGPARRCWAFIYPQLHTRQRVEELSAVCTDASRHSAAGRRKPQKRDQLQATSSLPTPTVDPEGHWVTYTASPSHSPAGRKELAAGSLGLWLQNHDGPWAPVRGHPTLFRTIGTSVLWLHWWGHEMRTDAEGWGAERAGMSHLATKQVACPQMGQMEEEEPADS